jgi:hypothetical protein
LVKQLENGAVNAATNIVLATNPMKASTTMRTLKTKLVNSMPLAL